MIFYFQKQNFPLSLKDDEKYSLGFSPVCDFFEEGERLYLPGSRIVHVDFSSGKISLAPFEKENNGTRE